MKKKVLSMLLASAMALSIVACGQSDGGAATTSTETTGTDATATEQTQTETTEARVHQKGNDG